MKFHPEPTIGVIGFRSGKEGKPPLEGAPSEWSPVQGKAGAKYRRTRLVLSSLALTTHIMQLLEMRSPAA